MDSRGHGSSSYHRVVILPSMPRLQEDELYLPGSMSYLPGGCGTNSFGCESPVGSFHENSRGPLAIPEEELYATDEVVAPPPARPIEGPSPLMDSTPHSTPMSFSHRRVHRRVMQEARSRSPRSTFSPLFDSGGAAVAAALTSTPTRRPRHQPPAFVLPTEGWSATLMMQVAPEDELACEEHEVSVITKTLLQATPTMSCKAKREGKELSLVSHNESSPYGVSERYKSSLRMAMN